MRNTVIDKGNKMISMSRQNQQRGPGNKNLGPNRVSRPNPAPMVRSMAGKTLRGPDKGGG